MLLQILVSPRSVDEFKIFSRVLKSGCRIGKAAVRAGRPSAPVLGGLPDRGLADVVPDAIRTAVARASIARRYLTRRNGSTELR